ncbi:hypothetical protein B9Z19DRAFT_1069534 [Tuber borchii]|uniref:Uncharacterized protein n=1 Tax=Tuber borchii TaxID=42251 RepID=A0A2T6ZB86_TUBBO|nr:hypothetical protein B9Z19DRAFT_1069534 [Tuber borchii]
MFKGRLVSLKVAGSWALRRVHYTCRVRNGENFADVTPKEEKYTPTRLNPTYQQPIQPIARMPLQIFSQLSTTKKQNLLEDCSPTFLPTYLALTNVHSASLKNLNTSPLSLNCWLTATAQNRVLPRYLAPNAQYWADLLHELMGMVVVLEFVTSCFDDKTIVVREVGNYKAGGEAKVQRGIQSSHAEKGDGMGRGNGGVPWTVIHHSQSPRRALAGPRSHNQGMSIRVEEVVSMLRTEVYPGQAKNLTI